MKKLLLLPLVLLLLFTGCRRTEFTVSSARIVQNRTDDVRTAVFSFFPSDEKSDYAVTLTSPDGNLVWKGNGERKADGGIRFELAITEGTDFPAGDWTYMIYSTEGTEKEGTVRFPGAMDIGYSLEWPTVTFDVPGSVYAVRDGMKEEVKSPLDLTGISRIEYTDGNFNTYSFTVNE